MTHNKALQGELGGSQGGLHRAGKGDWFEVSSWLGEGVGVRVLPLWARACMV